MTDKDGQIVASYEYDSWGNVLKSDTKGIAADNPFGYAGYMYDKEIGMYYLIARYYNPEHGVFLSVDPDPGDEDDPVTQNGYTYGWKSSRSNSKKQIANLSPGQRVQTQQILKNAVKSATKGALFTGSKAVGGIGLIPDAAVFIDGDYKGYKKGYKDYKPKKTNSKKRRR